MAVIFNIQEAVKLSQFNVLQEPIQTLVNGQTEQWEKNSFIDKIFVVRTTDKFQEEFRTTTSMGGFRPTEDLEPPHISDFDEGYRKAFRTQIWTNSFVVSQQALEDNKGIEINAEATGFIKGYGRTREQYAFAMLAGALKGQIDFEGKKFDCRGADTIDGDIEGTKQIFFHNKHKAARGVHGANVTTPDQSNKFYVEGGINLSEGGATAKLADIVGQVASKMQNYTNDNGEILLVNPDTVILPNHYSFKTALLTALKSDKTAAMGGNAINLIAGNYNIVITPYLNRFDGFGEADQSFIMMDSSYNKDVLGAVWFDRVPLSIKSYIDENTGANVWSGRARYGAGFNNFRPFAYCATGANASAIAKSDADTLTPNPLDGGASLVLGI